MIFEKRTALACSAADAFRYHAHPLALVRLTPPFERVRHVQQAPLVDGSVTTLDVAIGPAWLHVRSRHVDVREGRGFVDVMERGPFPSWRHTHSFEPAADGAGCTLVDHIEYTPPAGGAAISRRRLERMFTYRHAKTAHDLALFASLPRDARLTIGLTGASGLVGQELSSLLSAAGHDIVRLSRTAGGGGVRWDPSTGALEGADALALDAVVHLAGEPIAQGRLDDAHKARVRASRVDATRKLVASLAQLARRPRVFVSASAVGYYGDRAGDVLDDDATRGTGFLADLCADWEQAAQSAAAHGMRAVALRYGIVLSPSGGALGKMLPAFRAGAGAQISDGRHWMPLLSVDDAAGFVLRALLDDRVRGPINATGPEPLTNADFTATVARVLSRPALLRIPRAAAALMFGRAFVDEALCVSQRVVPRRFSELGHAFRHSTCEAALRHVLGRASSSSSSAQ